jgi:hypothetical protein
MIDVADYFALANDSDPIGGSVLGKAVARDNRKHGHYHQNSLAHDALLPNICQKRLDIKPISAPCGVQLASGISRANCPRNVLHLHPSRKWPLSVIHIGCPATAQRT